MLLSRILRLIDCDYRFVHTGDGVPHILIMDKTCIEGHEFETQGFKTVETVDRRTANTLLEIALAYWVDECECSLKDFILVSAEWTAHYVARRIQEKKLTLLKSQTLSELEMKLTLMGV